MVLGVGYMEVGTFEVTVKTRMVCRKLKHSYLFGCIAVTQEIFFFH